MKRISIFLAGGLVLTFNAYPADNNDPPLEPHVFLFDMGTGFVSGMSQNGLWGLYRQPDFDEKDAVARRMNLQTGEIEELPLIPEQGAPHICAAHDITNDGNRIFGAYDRLPAYYDLADAQWHDLPLNFRSRGYTGSAGDVTPDGSWACGWLMGSISSFRPALWHNGEAVELGDLPTYEEMHAKGIIDDEDYKEHTEKNQTPNIAFWKVSDDGKYVLASTDHNYPNWGCAYFIYFTETGTYKWIEDPKMPAKCFTSGASMSDSGEWVSGTWTGTKVMPDGTWDDVHTGFRMHLPDGEIDYQAGGGHIGNDGKPVRLSVNVDGVNVSYPSIMRQVYGLDVKTITGFDSFGTLFEVSTDGRTVLCQPGYRQYAISASCPVPFSEAALKVNLLGESKVFPTPGATLSRFEEFTIEFSTKCTHDADIVPRMLCDGETVAEASGVKDTGNGRRFTVSFDGLLLEAGKNYELFLPEGMFTSVSGVHRMPEGRVPYSGREDKALAPVSVTPQDGTAIQELSTFSLISLMFDSEPLKTDDAEAFLYQGDDEIPLTALNIAVDGRRVVLYPSAGRPLMKGREYRIVIKDGSFTDITGNCPNEEIVLRYSGSYSPVQTSGNILFEDSFDNPNESLYRFLLYEGDHNEPSAAMQAWGFDADNTPWNFSVRDEADYNYCAASTSDYKGGGQADDWMVIPRLSKLSGKEILSFKAQSYLLGRDDRLRIYVWESEDDLLALDASTIGKIRNDGTLIFDEGLKPGVLEDVLNGDWVEYSLPLRDFQGKSVFIAFANTNENGSAIFVDDIRVERNDEFTFSADIPESIVGQEPLTINCTLSSATRTIGRLKAEYEVEGSDVKGSFEASDIVVSKETPYYFSFPQTCTLKEGEYNRILFKLNADGVEIAAQYDVANPLFRAKRGVLLEEGTGEWCGYCPSGFVALDYLNKTYPGCINEVSVHQNDTYAFENYIAFLGFSSFPNGRIDRLPEFVMPVVSDMNTGLMSLTGNGNTHTFVDLTEQQLALPPLAEITVRDFSFNRETSRINATVSVTPTLNLHDVDWNLFSVVTEYDLPGLQQNNYAGSSDPLMSEWSDLGGKTMYQLPAVARAVVSSSFYGDSGKFPSELVAGYEYPVEISYDMPDVISDPEKCRLVVALLSANDGKAINSTSIGYGVEGSDVKTPESAKGSFSLVNGTMLFNGSAEGVKTYSLSGIEIPNVRLSGNIIAVHSSGKTVKMNIR